VARELGEINYSSGYAGLVGALRRRATELQIATGGAAAAEVAGLPVSYLGKLLSPLSGKSRENVRRLGIMSLGPVLGALGCKLVMIEDDDALQRFTSRIPARDPRAVRAATLEFHISRQFMRKIQRQGGIARWQGKTPAQRSAWARRMNRIRWAREKAAT
jgi:hypothetical protein